MIIKFTEYLHGEYDSDDEYPDEIKEAREHFSERDYNDFRRAFYEVSVDCEVDTETGDVVAVAFQGQPLANPAVV